ncbi:MAG: phage holin family protein [Ruminococcus sp.]|nr:phage holin family protein [Ruminococcus sp.]
MQKLTISSIIAGIGGFAAWFLGGWDELIICHLTLMVIDYLTGVAKAVCEKKLSSKIGFRGIIKKFLALLVIGLSVTLQTLLPDGVPLREITVLFFIANEGFSILENADGLIPLPQKLRNVLLQLQSKAEDKADSDAEESDTDTTEE